MREIKFERTVWAEKQLANLCPNHDISRISEVFPEGDLVAQIDVTIKLICILNEAYERKAHFLDKAHEIDVITAEEIECMNEQELITLSNKAFEVFTEDGKGTIETEPKK